MAGDRSQLVRRTENPLHGFKIFESDAFDHIGVVLKLAKVIMCVAVKSIDTKSAIFFEELRSERRVLDGC